ncbi:MAG: RNA polymerase sigma factor [Sedimentisphaerales bacterium]|nr:RNA polymerase sigma factor [Sedimentisphaerales bacterium]
MNQPNVLNESALVCGAQRGDRSALKTLLLRNWGWMKGLVRSILSDCNDVDDVLQNICVRVIGKIETLREPERFRPWLVSLARNEAISFQRKKKRQPIRLEPDQFVRQSDQKAFEETERAEQQRRLTEAIDRLPEKYRQALLLQLMGNMSYNDIAQLLEIPVTTLQVRLVRARRMVQDMMLGKEVIRVPRT